MNQFISTYSCNQSMWVGLAAGKNLADISQPLCGCKGSCTPTHGCNYRTGTNLLALFSHSHLSWIMPKKVKYH